ncbi:MAG: glycoside hydrolase [Treponema sp.]|nr:glycoside hydrolase [Treponema sp.]
MKRFAGCLYLLPLFFSLLAACSGGPSPAAKNPGAAEDTAFWEEFGNLLTFPASEAELPVSSFPEIWGYVVAGRESALSKNLPLSDIGYFGAEIDAYGKLTDVPNPRNIRNFSGRVHLVVACNSRSLTHFVLMEGSAERKALIADLLTAAKNFTGLQIDFEYIPQRDGGAFLSFLGDLRAGLGGKMFTIALPARTRPVNNDVFDYRKIKPLVDRILVMAYDEHWSASAPGPIASLSWCRRVAEYALAEIGPEKLIMGLPFYGRAWGSTNPSKAYLYSSIKNLLDENHITEIRRENGIPTFNYEVPVKVRVYYEDAFSLSARMELYKALGVRHIGFWRLGQETPVVWKLLRLGNEDHLIGARSR